MSTPLMAWVIDAAMAHPEGVLVQLFGDPHRLDSAFADQQRPQHVKSGLDQPGVGEDAANAEMPFARS